MTPFLVEVDRTGALLGIDQATSSRKLSDVQLAYQLGRFITNFRSKSIDPVVIKQDWLDAYAFASGQARQTLNDQANHSDPFADIGHKAVSVEINSVVRLSETSMQVRWTERAYDNGALTATDRYVGVLTLLNHPARTEAELRANPFGFNRRRHQLHQGKLRRTAMRAAIPSAFVLLLAACAPTAEAAFDRL